MNASGEPMGAPDTKHVEKISDGFTVHWMESMYVNGSAEMLLYLGESRVYVDIESSRGRGNEELSPT